MKTKVFVYGLAAAILMASCGGNTGGGSSEAVANLPEVNEEAVWDFWYSIPSSDLPASCADVSERKEFKALHDKAAEEYEYDEIEGDNTDFLMCWAEHMYEFDYDWSEDDPDSEHKSLCMYLYAKPQPGLYFGVVSTCTYDFSDETTLEYTYKYYDFDRNKGKATEVKALPIDKKWTDEDFISDPMLTVGYSSLYYDLKDGKFEYDFAKEGFGVYVSEAFNLKVNYKWTGSKFAKQDNGRAAVISDYGLAGLSLDNDLPSSVSGYIMKYDSDYEGYGNRYVYTLKGDKSPSVALFTGDTDSDIWQIEVFTDRYETDSGVYVGMKVTEAKKLILEEAEKWGYEEEITVSYNEYLSRVDMFTQYGELVYVIDPSYYHDGELSDDAVIEKIVIINAVG